jgi:haloacetate dehalogenase
LAVSDRGVEDALSADRAGLRGYGATDKAPTGYDKRTMANDIRALMSNLGIERAVIVAHDRGARGGLRLANDHPDAVARFAALD